MVVSAVLRTALTAALVMLSSGCVAPIAIGAAGAAGATAVKATEDRGLSGAASDVQIQAAINERWFKHNVDMFQRVRLSIDEGRVMLTGRAANEDQRADAARLVREVDGVREVFNDIVLDRDATLGDSARDTWISTQLRSALLVDGDVHSTNYSLDVVDGVVYLLGVAHGEAELRRVVDHAKSLSRVRGVVSHVRVI